MEIYLKDEYSGDISGAKYICNYIGFTKLQDIVERTMIIYENRNDETSIEEDVEYIRTYQEFADAIEFRFVQRTRRVIGYCASFSIRRR